MTAMQSYSAHRAHEDLQNAQFVRSLHIDFEGRWCSADECRMGLGGVERSLAILGNRNLQCYFHQSSKEVGRL